MDTQDKATLLNTLESEILIIAGEVAMAKVGYFPQMDMIEERLGTVLDAIVSLKSMEGIPTNLHRAEVTDTSCETPSFHLEVRSIRS